MFEAKRTKKVSDVAFHGQLASLSVSVTIPCRSTGVYRHVLTIDGVLIDIDINEDSHTPLVM